MGCTKQVEAGANYGGSRSPVISWSRSVSPPSNSLGSWCSPVSPLSAGSMSPPSIISPSRYSISCCNTVF